MVKIVTDTTSGLSLEVAQHHRISVIPQMINFGNDSYLEGIDLDSTQFMQKLRNSVKLPQTATPPPELFVREFNKLVPLSVMHAAVPDLATDLAGEICKEYNLSSIPILDVSPAIITHGGPGILTVAFLRHRVIPDKHNQVITSLVWN